MFRKLSFLCHIFFFMLVGSLILTACGGADPEDTITIFDQQEDQKKTVVEKLNANNCNGSADMKQNLEARKQYSHTIEILPELGLKYNRQSVERAIQDRYNIYDLDAEQVCLVPVQVPAGTFYSYSLEWKEVWREGYFEQGEADGNSEGTYRFLQNMLCEVVAQNSEKCP